MSVRITSSNSMKLATRISSIRRSASKACRSCSPASASMCPDSVSRWRDAGCTRSPAASSTLVTGLCASHSMSRSGLRPAQLLRDRHVAARVSQADRRAQIQDPASSSQRTGPGDLLCRGRGYRVDEIADQRVDEDGVAAGEPVAGLLDQGEAAAGQFGEAFPDCPTCATDHLFRARRGPGIAPVVRCRR